MNKNYNLIWQALENTDFGSISITLPNNSIKSFRGRNEGPKAEITINDNNLIDEVITGGDVAFGESYIEKKWDSQNLANLLTFLTLNAHNLENFFHARKIKALILFISSLIYKNTKRGSKKNITAHYDLGNDFYELWLDKSMTYSSAFFNNEDCDLFTAQIKKYQNILSKLNDGSILEIGCGWGGFAEQAIINKRNITCLTISKKQQEYSQKRIDKISQKDLAQIKLQDYRDEKNQYDNIVSIEMFEAVGKEYWDKYFQTLNKCLKKEGKALLQIITIDEEVFKDYINRVDFIQKHIFPGGILPSKSVIHNLAKKHGFEIKSETNFGLDYAKTLQIWLENFDNKFSEVSKLGFNEGFIRKWRFYLCYCIAGFNSKRTDVVQFEIKKR